MISPETYTGTSKSGKHISVTAQDASKDIDCEAIKSTVESIKETAKETLEGVSFKVRHIEAGKDTLSVEDKTLKPLIDEVSDWIEALPKEGIYESLDSAAAYAEERHDEFQEQYNKEAKAEKDRRVAAE